MLKVKLCRLGVFLVGFGVALVTEKIVNYGAVITPPLPFDHGLYGVISIVIGTILTYKYRKKGDGDEGRKR